MHIRKLALMGAAACLPALFLACGDGADDEGDAPTTAASAEASATAATSETAPAVDASPTPGFTPVAFEPEDAAYAARLCTAFDDYSAEITAMLANDPDLSTDIEKLLTQMTPILEELQLNVRSADPTDAIKPYHDAALENVNALLAAVREGRIEQLADFNTQLGVAKPPQDAEDRVRSASIDVPECEGNNLFFAAPPADE